MSTDRELLELAARATGVKGTYQHWEDSRGNISCRIAPDGAVGRLWWNPLKDDGDALRLMVHLSIFPDILHDKTGVLSGYELKRNSWAPIVEKFSDDHYATMRRAIVRAAAEIGRAVQ